MPPEADAANVTGNVASLVVRLALADTLSGVTVAVTDGAFAVTEAPFASVTVTFAEKVPALAYTWLGFWAVEATVASPKFQLKP